MDDSSGYPMAGANGRTSDEKNTFSLRGPVDSMHDAGYSPPSGPPTTPGQEPGTVERVPPPRPVAVWLLLLLCLILYGISCPHGQWHPTDASLVRFGAKVNHLIDAGEVWRLLSCAFLHGFPAHLILNMLALFSLGYGLEIALGSRRLLCLFVSSALFASLASYGYNSAISVGASGALFGLFGTELVCYGRILRICRRRNMNPPPGVWHSLQMGILFLGINFFLGLILPAVDNTAHLGGLAAGCLMGLTLPIGQNLSGAISPWRRIALNAAAGLSLGLLAYTGLSVYRFASRVTPAQLRQHVIAARKSAQSASQTGRGGPGGIDRWFPGRGVTDFQRGVEHHERQELDEAEAAYLRALDSNPALVEAHFNLGLVYLQRHQHDLAIERFLRVTELQPQSSDAYRYLGLLYSMKGSFTLAHESFEKAVELDPENVPAHRELGRSFERFGLKKDALFHYREAERLDPEDGQTRYDLGLFLVREGQEDAARLQLEKLRSLNASLARELQARIEGRFGSPERGPE
ncbi:MAG: rhomboid family intramembrane serine protease [Planctomycetes bacterium]|nr:rhomboid family intramembrane serine protease [Planctomycetota bacterium]